MHKYRFTELLCVALVIVFIFFSMADRKNTIDMTAAEIADSICAELCSELSARDRAYVREKLEFDPEIFDSFVSFSSDDIMDVREIFIGVAVNKVDSTVIKACEAYQSEKFNLYNGYAPREAAMLENAVIRNEDNIFIFIVCEDSASVASAFDSLM